MPRNRTRAGATTVPRDSAIMNRRLAILFHWLLGRQNGVSARELLRFLTTPPSARRAQPLIRIVQEEKSVYRIHLVGIDEPLVWPRRIDLKWLYMTLVEQAYPEDWHFYQTPETSVHPNDVVVDCGAAEGLFSLLVAKRARRVYAIEPLPLWVECMHETFRDQPKVDILPYALSNENGSAQLQGCGFMSRLDTNGEVKVAVTTIDDLFAHNGIEVSYLKADLEGHDLKMLQGARETISRFTPRIAITTYHDPRHAAMMIDYLSSLNRGYRFRTRGIEARTGAPVMLHAWIER